MTSCSLRCAKHNAASKPRAVKNEAIPQWSCAWVWLREHQSTTVASAASLKQALKADHADPSCFRKSCLRSLKQWCPGTVCKFSQISKRGLLNNVQVSFKNSITGPWTKPTGTSLHVKQFACRMLAWCLCQFLSFLCTLLMHAALCSINEYRSSWSSCGLGLLWFK